MSLWLIRVVGVVIFLFGLSIKGCCSGCGITDTSTRTPTSLEKG
jgi:Fe-S cluster biogenesis protein NfuA